MDGFDGRVAGLDDDREWAVLSLPGGLRILPLRGSTIWETSFLPRMPSFARVALLSACLLIPLALGEGLLGLGCGFFVIGVLYGRSIHRTTLALAVLLLTTGTFVVTNWAGQAADALEADPVASSAPGTDSRASHIGSVGASGVRGSLQSRQTRHSEPGRPFGSSRRRDPTPVPPGRASQA